jgi:hypothetical protein
MSICYFFYFLEYDRFLAFSKVTGIETIHMYESSSDEDVPNPNAPRIAIENAEFMRNVIGLTCDYKSQRYFFSDIQRGDIQSVRFNGSDFRVIIESKSNRFLSFRKTPFYDSCVCWNRVVVNVITRQAKNSSEY